MVKRAKIVRKKGIGSRVLADEPSLQGMQKQRKRTKSARL